MICVLYKLPNYIIIIYIYIFLPVVKVFCVIVKDTHFYIDFTFSVTKFTSIIFGTFSELLQYNFSEATARAHGHWFPY